MIVDQVIKCIESNEFVKWGVQVVINLYLKNAQKDRFLPPCYWSPRPLEFLNACINKYLLIC